MRRRNTTDENRIKNVVIYCRVSSEEQKKGSSLEVQEERLVSECRRRGYNIIDIPHWEDKSGKTFKKRPVISNILKYAKNPKNKVDMIWCLRWNRFSRRLSQATDVVEDLLYNYDVEVNAIEEHIDFNSASWPQLLGVYIGQAQSDNISRSKGTRDGIHGTLEKGKWPNKAPRGYKNKHVTDKNGFVIDKYVDIDPEIGPIVRKVFIEIAKGVESPCYIRRKLCPSIPESTFLEMIRNPFYKGKVFVPEYKGKPEHFVNGVHSALIEEENFDKVQDILDGKRKKTPKLTKAVNPDLYLRKFLVCPVCGHALTGSESKGNGGKYAYYHCCHDGKHLRKPASEVNEGFVRYVSCLTPNDEVLALYQKILFDIRDEDKLGKRKEADKLQEQLNAITRRIQRAKDMYIDGDLSKAEKEEALERYQKESDALKQQIELLTNPNRANIEPKLKYSISLLDNMKGFFRDAPVAVKIKLLSSIFPEKIEFDGKNYRTTGYNKVLDLIYQQTKELREPKKVSGESLATFPASVPRAGIEPARLAALVFETNASTNSAIWAYIHKKWFLRMQSYELFYKLQRIK